MRVYIAGPMTGLPEWNFPAFHAAAAEWRERGWIVENPAEAFGGAIDRPYKDYVEYDLDVLQTCDAVAVLPGWDGPNARGSVWERGVALKLLHIPVYDAMQPVMPWSEDNDPRGGQIMIADYGEWREFQQWRRLHADERAYPLMVMTPLPSLSYAVPLSQHPVTGALGRWVL